jgi:hypothetical protein
LAALIEPVEVHFQWRPQSGDPNDEMVIEAAINGRADALVTFTVKDFAGPAEGFGISVLRPADLSMKVKPCFCCGLLPWLAAVVVRPAQLQFPWGL